MTRRCCWMGSLRKRKLDPLLEDRFPVVFERYFLADKQSFQDLKTANALKTSSPPSSVISTSPLKLRSTEESRSQMTG